MGRGKIEIKRIENVSNRQVTYSKRRNGIMKKAKEITVLCDAQVSLIIFASSGRMHEYCSPSTSLVHMLDKYQKQSGKKLWDPKHENLSNEIDRIKKENDNMQIELRHLKGEDITSLPIKDLIAMEDALENGLVNIRSKMMEYYNMKKRNIKILEEENEQLGFVLTQQEKDQMHQNGSYHQQPQHSNYSDHRHHHMPYGFCVQPIHPNLQDRTKPPSSPILYI